MIDNLNVLINTEEENSLKNFKSTSNLIRCPRCGKYHIVRNGTYKRKVTIIKEESIVITIQKYICRSCDISFKELPLFLSSRNHLSIGSLLKVIINEDSLKKASKVFELSKNTIKLIRKKYKVEKKRIELLLRKYELHSLKEALKRYLIEFNSYLFEPSTSLDTTHPYVYRIS